MQKLFGTALTLLLLTVGIWAAPGTAGASDLIDDVALTASINVPLNSIQEGQYCVAYANVYNGTPPYTYAWSGTYFWGSTQIVDAYMWGEDGYVYLEVWDANDYDDDLVWLDVESGHQYNPSCEG